MIKKQITERINLVVDFKTYLEDIDTGKRVLLSATEYETIEKLTTPADRDYTYSELGKAFSKDELWEPTDDKKKMLRTRISRARKKLNEVFQGAGDQYIKNGYQCYKFVSGSGSNQFQEIFSVSVADMDNMQTKLNAIMREMEKLQTKLNAIMREMEKLQEQISGTTTSIQMVPYYKKHMETLGYQYDRLYDELKKRYLQAEAIRNRTYSEEVAAQHVEDLSVWMSSAVTEVEDLSNTLDEAIYQFLCGNIEDFSEIIDGLPINKQTTHVLYELVHSFDLPELYETLLGSRKVYLGAKELERLKERAKDIFIPEVWRSWGID